MKIIHDVYELYLLFLFTGDSEKSDIRSALQLIMDVTCLKFVEYQSSNIPRDHVMVRRSDG